MPTRRAPTSPATLPLSAVGPSLRPSSGAPSSSVLPSSSPSADRGSPPTGRPLAGPGITEPGIQLIASPASDGSFDVSELVLLPVPQTELLLRPPPISQAGNEFRSRSPVATAIQLTAGDQPVILPSDTLRAALTVPLASSERRFELRYQLSGVTIRSTPSKAGRALAAIGPLTGVVAADLPVAVTVIGNGVRNLECRQLALDERPCASGELPELRVNRVLRWQESVVVVQLDLSSPR